MRKTLSYIQNNLQVMSTTPKSEIEGKKKSHGPFLQQSERERNS